MHSTALDKYCVTLIVSTPQSQKMRDHYRNKVGPREGRSASEPRFLCLDSPPTLAGTSNQLQKESAQPSHTSVKRKSALRHNCSKKVAVFLSVVSCIEMCLVA